MDTQVTHGNDLMGLIFHPFWREMRLHGFNFFYIVFQIY